MSRNLRRFSTVVSEMFENRNPRNLELMTIGYKPYGFHLEVPGRSFWHKLDLKRSNKGIQASIVHFENGPIISISTNDWPIRKHLYKPCDLMAHKVLAQVLADRCFSIGVNCVQSFISSENSEKVRMFLETLEQEGMILKELERYRVPKDNEYIFSPKVWEHQYD